MLLGFVLDLCKFFLYFGDMVSVSIEKLCFVLFDDVLYLFVHFIDRSIEIAIGLEDRLGSFCCDKCTLDWLHSINFIVDNKCKLLPIELHP